MELQKKFKSFTQVGRTHSKINGWLNLIQEKIANNESFAIVTLNRERSQTIICELKKRKLTFDYKFTDMGISINTKKNDSK